MSLIDTHTHFNLKRLYKDVSTHIDNLKANQVIHAIVPGIDLNTSRLGLELAHRYPDLISTAVGIHPETVISDQFEPGSLGHLESLIQNKQVVAVGEIGLDFHYAQDLHQQSAQIKFFIHQFKLACRYNKSIIIHCRQASQTLLPLLTDLWISDLQHRIVFHCCEPQEALLKFAVDHAIYIGVDGDVTYDQTKSEFISIVPLAQLVLETDSPFLLPEPLRSAKAYPNTSANLPIIARFIAQLKKTTLDQVAFQTTTNASKLFTLV